MRISSTPRSVLMALVLSLVASACGIDDGAGVSIRDDEPRYNSESGSVSGSGDAG